MEFKKIFALGLSATLMFSSVIANAELVVKDDDGNKVIVTAPTKDELLLRRPNISVTATKFNTQDEVTAATNKIWARKHNVADYDIYKLTFTASNLGGLYNGVNESYETKGAQVGIGLFKVSLGTTALSENYVAAASIMGGNISAKQTADVFNISFNASSTDNPYPYYDPNADIQYMENGSIDMNAVVVLPIGAVVNIDKITAQIGYTVNKINTEAVLGTVQDKLVIGTPVEEKHADITANLEGKFDRGYVWTTEITKGDKDIESFKAKFEAGEAVAERQIRNIADLVSKFDGKGNVSFQIGLETKKELTKATFTVNDGDDHAFDAPLSK